MQNEDVTSWEVPWTSLLSNDFWGSPLGHSGSHKSYRPLPTLTFRLNHQLAPAGRWRHLAYHSTNVALHSLATFLLVIYARRLFGSKATGLGPLIAGLMFAVHPIHTEAVAGLVGRQVTKK